MKKIVLFLFAFLILFNMAYAQIPPPSVYVIHHIWPADMEQPFGKYMISKETQTLFRYPGSPEVVDTITQGERVQLMTAALYTYPNKYPVFITDMPYRLSEKLITNNKGKKLPSKYEYVYLMEYTGEGLYLAWYEDQMLFIPGDGLQGIAVSYRGGENISYWGDFQGTNPILSNFWLCLRTKNGEEGWLEYTTYEKWEKNKYSIFFYNESQER